jgi:hypothetical protein
MYENGLRDMFCDALQEGFNSQWIGETGGISCREMAQ